MEIEELEPLRQPNAGVVKKPAPKRPFQWLVVAVIGLVVAGFVLTKYRRGAVSPTPVAGNLPTVAVVKVVRENLAEEQTFDAELRPYREIDLHAKVAGFVENIKVDIGDAVAQGEVLATLEIPELKEDLERANAQQLRNEKEIAKAAADYEDARLFNTRLVAINQSHSNLVAQQELDTALAKERVTEAALASAKQQVEVSKAEVDKLKAMQDYCKITAPFAGVITRRYADEGALVQGGVTPSATALPLVRLSQNDRLRLDFPVSVSFVSRIKIGDPVEIRIQTVGRTIPGKISRFTRKVNSDTRTMEAEVDVPNEDLSLTPGIYAVAVLKLDQREKVLTVPAEAISNPKAPNVFVLNAANEIEERPVTLGLETPGKYEILTGLKENELVMVGSRTQVRPGQKVEPKILETGSEP